MSDDPFFDDLLKSSSPSGSTRKPSAQPTSASSARPTSAAAAAATPSASALLRESDAASPLSSSQQQQQTAPVIAPPPPPAGVAASPSYLTCKVQHAVQGTEMIKPLTYFPLVISTFIPSEQSSSSSSFVPLPIAPHQRHCTPIAGQRRVRWETEGGGSSSGAAQVTVERRYSELLELRQLLVLQYPMLVIPPLPPKSTTDNFNTYMQSQAHLCQQMRNIARFVREIGKIPEIVLYNELVPNFFLYPRERLADWMGRIRDQSRALKGANTSLESRRERRHRAPRSSADGGEGGSGGAAASTLDSVEESVANIAAEGSRLVRGMMSSLSSWMSTPATGSAAAAAQDQKSLIAAADQRYQQHEQVQFWTHQEDILEKKFIILMDAADAMMKFIAADDSMNQALLDVAEALHGFEGILQDAGECFEPTKLAVHGVSTLARDNAEIHRRDGDRRYTQVYEMLLFEAGYLEAMQDSIGYVKCLWRRKLENDLDRYARPADVQQYQLYVAFVDDRLKTEVHAGWLKHIQRMRQLQRKYIEIPLDSFREEVQKTSVHPFMILSNTEAYSSY